MDDFTAEILASRQDEDNRAFSSPEQQRPLVPEPDPEVDPEPPATPSQHMGGLRGGLAAIREKANIQDRLVEK
jgi:hypothetical protein